MTSQYSEAVNTARDYYNSEDADNFYAIIWGGEDIHIGLYESDSDAIREASHRTVRHITEKTKLTPENKVLDIGSGYGGLARYIADTYGCSVVALNLSEKENERARMLNKERGLEDKIDVVDGSFENIPAEDNSFDVIFSQDAILHSGQREKVMQEVARVLKPGGKFIFTDPMAADDCPEGVLEPILNRIHLASLGSPAFYRQTLAKLGIKEVSFEEQTQQLINHYSRVLQETEKHESELTKQVDQSYVDRMKVGLGHWINGGKNGHLAWGFFVFQKEA